MNNAQIEMFSVMVQTGNIHHTAQRFGIDAASITTSICALENEIGFNLIVRGKNIRKVILTEKGKDFYKLTPEILCMLNAIATIRCAKNLAE
ncbi:LysR family transcriptional regulator [Klebsiella quasivariicola]|uniref:LysR family transcriptional regulator n=1 Tax=Klebsiella quasivariicola TaxID=2026240 RepID=UPI001CCB2878|nr:LysR family transcriptional regulator [Klebsiella quasivariicola]MBZ9579492.1 LysR family transcriptional regulator [Klebsiella quasivariicola]